MTILSNFFNWLFSSAASREQLAMESYLSQSVDIYDLEARQRQWDSKSQPSRYYGSY